MASFTDPQTDVVPLGVAVRELWVRARTVERRYLLSLAVAVPLAGLALARFGLSGRFVLAAGLIVVLCLLSAIDIAERRLPNRIVLPAFVLVLAAQSIFVPERALEWAAAAIGAALVLLLPLLVRPEGVGMGDVKLALLLGAALGTDVIGALLVASVAAACYAVVLLARDGAAARRATIPLGPFLALGGIAVLLV
ncbi:MAG TPA: prepilin peptidase [Gaiellaceae bacterium]|nr:prepilin peptidase [Gaiellaceae bacterium]